MSKKEPWDFWVLASLRGGKPTLLKDLYSAIEILKDGKYINPSLYRVDGRWGNRKDCAHVVRSTISHAAAKGWVEHVGKDRTGLYRITDSSLNELSRIEP